MTVSTQSDRRMKYMWMYILAIANITLLFISYDIFKTRSDFEYMLGNTKLVEGRYYEKGNFSIIVSKGTNLHQECIDYYRININTDSNPCIPLSASIDTNYKPRNFLIPRKEETREMLVDEDGDGIIDGVMNNNR